MSITVAFQGELGAYSEDAIVALWKAEAIPVASRSFEDVIAAVQGGSTHFGVLPMENTIAGMITSAQDVLHEALARDQGIEIVDHVTITIRHALLAPRGATLEGLTRVSSHPVALRQCRDFLATLPHVEVREDYDTAGAAREVAVKNDVRHAAIAGAKAAERYNLQILGEEIQDVPNNQTRFAVIAKNWSNRW